jgi:hypothetical protein
MRGATIKIPGRQTEYSWNEVGVACSETEWNGSMDVY